MNKYSCLHAYIYVYQLNFIDACGSCGHIMRHNNEGASLYSLKLNDNAI